LSSVCGCSLDRRALGEYIIRQLVKKEEGMLKAFVFTVLGVIVGFLAGYFVAILLMVLGYGMYSFLVGSIIWVAVTFLSFLLGLIDISVLFDPRS
jgi:hypothetical protein